MQGIIVKNISNDYTVRTGNKDYICKCSGKIKYSKQTPLVGDYVIFDDKNNYIEKILPRKNELIRPKVANIDIVLVITSVKNPDFDTYLLDKLLTIISFNNITPIICLTKLDLLTKEELEVITNYINYYESIGYTVITNTELDKLKELIKNKIVTFAGQSGAGKSSLLNKLDSSLNLQTNEISYALNRGKHTTRHCELHKVANGYVCDTPGFSSLDFSKMSTYDLANSVIEFKEYIGKCKFNDCIHENEPGCAIKEALKANKIAQSRYNNYLSVLQMIKQRKEKY